MATKVQCSSRSSANWWLAILPGLLLSLSGGVLQCIEAFRLGPLADADLVASYHFGSEAMVGNKGWPYVSRSTYVVSSAIEGAVLLVSAGILAVALGRRRLSWVLVGYFGLALVVVVTYWPIV